MVFHSGYRAMLVAWSLFQVALLTLGAEPYIAGESGAGSPVAQSTAKPRPQVTISKETTYITEPLRDNGYPDYVAALNQRLGLGVTLQNNAVVLFWSAMGPGKIDKTYREDYFQMLGMQPLPKQGGYFLSIDEYAAQPRDGETPINQASVNKRLAKALEEQDIAWQRPWSKDEFPTLAGWLTANEKPLGLMVEAFKRPRWYDPLVQRNDDDGNGLFPIAGITSSIKREIMRVFATRAMLQLREGNVEGAWEDLLTCHRLARLVGQGPMLIDTMTATTIDGMACVSDQVFLEKAKLTAAQLARMQDDLAKLPPLPKTATAVNIGERFTFLDCATMAVRKGLDKLTKIFTSGEEKSMLRSLIDSSGDVEVDWNIVLRIGNSWYDRLADALRKPTRAKRKGALDRIIRDLHNSLNTFANNKTSRPRGTSLSEKHRNMVSERAGKTLVCLFLPAYPNLVDHVEDRSTMQFELTCVAFALASYHTEHGSYPEKLALLKPKYMAEIPKDIFSGEDLFYRREGKDFVLYSVGANCKDDSGKGYFRNRKEEDGDDLVVRMLPATQQ